MFSVPEILAVTAGFPNIFLNNDTRLYIFLNNDHSVFILWNSYIRN